MSHASDAPDNVPVAHPADPAEIDDLLAEARELDRIGHPSAGHAWAAYAEVSAHSGTPVPAEAAAELAAARGLALLQAGDLGAAIVELERAARGFAALGRPAHATVARARAAVAHRHPQAPAGAGRPDIDDLGDLDAATDALSGLLAEDRATPAQFLAVLSCRVTAARLRLFAAEDRTAAVRRDDLAAEIATLAEAARDHDVLHRRAEAAEAQAQLALMAGDSAKAEPYLRSAITFAADARRPWQTVQPGRMLGRLLLGREDWHGAAAVLREVHDATRDFPDHATAYPELLADLARAAGAAGHPGAAAEALVVAAEHAADGGDPELHANLTARAAEALGEAGEAGRADAAYTAAIALMRAQGRPGAAVRLLRASAWNLLAHRPADRPDDGAVETALARFREAFADLDAADRARAATDDLDPALERAVTEHQYADALAHHGRDDEALKVLDRATARLELRLPALEEQYAALVHLAVDLEDRILGLPALTRARLDAALTVTRATGARTAHARLTALRDGPP